MISTATNSNESNKTAQSVGLTATTRGVGYKTARGVGLTAMPRDIGFSANALTMAREGALTNAPRGVGLRTAARGVGAKALIALGAAAVLAAGLFITNELNNSGGANGGGWLGGGAQIASAQTAISSEVERGRVPAGETTAVIVSVASAPTSDVAVTVTLTGDTDGLAPISGATYGGSYDFEAEAGTWEALGSGATTEAADSGNGEDTVYTGLTIPFAFDFYGTTYAANTNVGATSRGFISFNSGATLTGRQNNGAGGQGPTNHAELAPYLSPLWDRTGYSMGTVKTQTLGTSPNRVWVFEAVGVLWRENAQPDDVVVDYQVRLHEGTNVIEFIYNAAGSYADPNGATATIGIAGSTDAFVTLADAGADPTVDRATRQVGVSARPANGQIYRFIPSAAATATISSGATSGALELTAGSGLAFGASADITATLSTAASGFSISDTHDIVVTGPGLTAALSPTTIAAGETAVVTVTLPSGQTAPTGGISVGVAASGDTGRLTPGSAAGGGVYLGAYDFEAVSGTYAPLTGATDATDDLSTEENLALYLGEPIGFDFNFYGTTYTSVSLSGRGFLALGTRTVTELQSLVHNTNDNFNAAAPAIYPVYDANQIPTSGHSNEGSSDYADVSYKTEGAAPNRVFTFEVQGLEWRSARNAAVQDFQVKLYETTNVIEIVYDTGNLSGATYQGVGPTGGNIGATIGIANSATDRLILSDSSASPTVGAAFVDNIVTRPANDQIYRFTPQQTGPYNVEIAAGESSGTLDLGANADAMDGEGVALALSANTDGYAVARAGSQFQLNFGATTTMPDPMTPVDPAESSVITLEFAPASIFEGGTTTLTATATPAVAETVVVSVALSGAGYVFEAEAGSFEPLDSGVSQLSKADDAIIGGGALSIGFEFPFYGRNYTEVTAVSNGYLTFDPSDLGGSSTLYHENGFNRNRIAPALFPLWEDLNPSSGQLRAATLGSAPNRVFVYEVLGSGWDPAAFSANAVIDYQVRLYESTGAIEFVYDTGNASGTYGNPTSGASATIGVAQSESDYLTLSDRSASPTAQSGVFTTNIATAPANDQVYRFTPTGLRPPASLVLNPGDTSATVDLTAASGFLDDGQSETITATFAATTGTVASLTPSATLTINDAADLTASVSPTDLSSGAAATLTVATADGANVAADVTVNVALSGGLAGLTQTVSYDFAAEQGAYSRLDTGLSQIDLTAGAGDLDNGVSELIDIGFDFELYGVAYRNLRATTNGILSFNATVTDANLAAAHTQSGTQPAATAPAIYALASAGGSHSAAEVRTHVIGNAGARVFIYEVTGARLYAVGDANPTTSYQVRLYEGSNKIEIVYDNIADSTVFDNFLSLIVGVAASSSVHTIPGASTAADLLSPIRSNFSGGLFVNPTDGLTFVFEPTASTTVTIPNGSSSGTATLTAAALRPGALHEIGLSLTAGGGYELESVTQTLSLTARRDLLTLTGAFNPTTADEGDSVTFTLMRQSDANFTGAQVVRVRVSGDAGSLTDSNGDALNAVFGGYHVEALQGTYTPLDSSVPTLSRSGVTHEKADIGFGFEFYGGIETVIYGFSDGVATFTPTTLIRDGNHAYGLGDFEKNFANIQALLPFWDEFGVKDYEARAATLGGSEGRVFVFEWKDLCWFNCASDGNASFQLRLYEHSNIIEYVYNVRGGEVSNNRHIGGSVGIVNNARDFLSLDTYGRRGYSFLEPQVYEDVLRGYFGKAVTPRSGALASQNRRQTIIPPVGLTYRFTPVSEFDLTIGSGQQTATATYTAASDTNVGTPSAVEFAFAPAPAQRPGVYQSGTARLALSDDDTVDVTPSLDQTNYDEGESVVVTVELAQSDPNQDVTVRVTASGATRFAQSAIDITVASGDTVGTGHFDLNTDARVLLSGESAVLSFVPQTVGYVATSETLGLTILDVGDVVVEWQFPGAPLDRVLSEGDTLLLRANLLTADYTGSDVPIAATFAYSDSGDPPFFADTPAPGAFTADENGLALTLPYGASQVPSAIYTLRSDNIPSAGESVTISFTSHPRLQITGATAGGVTFTLSDDDEGTVSAEFAPAAITQGDNAVLNFAITAPEEGGGAAEDIVYDVEFSGTSAADLFASTTHSATILEGETTATLSVATLASATLAADETITATITRRSDIVYNAPASVELFVMRQQLNFNATISASSAAENGSAVVTLTPAAALRAAADVSITITGDTDRLSSASRTVSDLSFAKDATTGQSFTLTALNNDLIDGDATVNIAFSSAAAGFAANPASLDLTITDDDEQELTTALGNTTLTEGGADVNLTITRPAATSETFVLNLALSGTDAERVTIEDETMGPFVALIAPSEDSVTVALRVVDNDVADADGSATLTLTSQTSGVTIASGDESYDLTIVDTDVNLTAAWDAATVGEGDGAVLRLNAVDANGDPRAAPADAAATVFFTGDVGKLRDENGNAVAARSIFDLTIGTSETTTTLNYTIADDDLPSGDQTATANLASSLSLNGVTDGTRTTLDLTITDSDFALSAGLATLRIDEGVTQTLEVEREDTAGSLSIAVAVSGEGAADVMLSQTTIDFADGDKKASIDVMTANDHFAGRESAAVITLTAPDGGGYAFGTTDFMGPYAVERDLNLTLLDNDTELVGHLTRDSIDETEITTLTVRTANGQPAHSNVDVRITPSGDTGGVTVLNQDNSVIFGAFNVRLGVDETQTVARRIVARNDNNPGDSSQLTLTFRESADGYFFGTAPAFTNANDVSTTTADLTLTDDDVALTINLAANAVTEGDTVALTVSRPLGVKNADRAVEIVVVFFPFERSDGEGGDTIALNTLEEGSLVRIESGSSPSNISRVITIPANEETSNALELGAIQNTTRGDTTEVTISASTSTGGFGFRTGEDKATLTLRDDDGLLVLLTEPSISAETGVTTLRIEADQAPASDINVTVTFPADLPTGLLTQTSDGSAIAPGATESFIIRTTDATNLTRMLGITAAKTDDDFPADPIAIDIGVEASGGAMFTGDVRLTLVDPDVLLTPRAESDSVEEGETITVYLTRAVANAEVVTATVTSDNTRVSFPDGADLTIPAGALESNRVNGVAANDHAASSGDSAELTFTVTEDLNHGFDGDVYAETLALTLTDDDLELILNLAVPGATPNTLEEGETATLTIATADGSAVTDDVTVSVEVGAGASLLSADSNTTATLTIPSGSSTSGGLALGAANDNNPSAGGTVSITASETADGYFFAPAPAFTGPDDVSSGSATLTITDADVGLTPSLTRRTVSEGGETIFTLTRPDNSANFATEVSYEFAYSSARADGGSGGISFEFGEPGGMPSTIAPGDTGTQSGSITASMSGGSEFRIAPIQNTERGDTTEVTFTLTSNTAGFGFAPGDDVVVITLQDDDGVIVGLTDSSISTESDNTSLTIAADRTPTNDIVVDFVFPANLPDGYLQRASDNSAIGAGDTLTLTISATPSQAHQLSETLVLNAVKAADDFPAAPLTLDIAAQTRPGSSEQFSGTLSLTLVDPDTRATATVSPLSIDEGERATLSFSRPTGVSGDIAATVSTTGGDESGIEFVDSSGAVVANRTLTISGTNTTSGSLFARQTNDHVAGASSTVDIEFAIQAGENYGFSESERTQTITLTLTDDDTELAASFAETSIAEGGSTTLSVSTTGGGNVSEDVVVSVTLSGDTARLSAPTGTTFDLTIPSGSATSNSVTLTQADDDIPSAGGTITATLSESQDGYYLASSSDADSSATVTLTLTDDDVRLTPNFTNNPIAEGGDTVFTVTRATASAETIDVLVGFTFSRIRVEEGETATITVTAASSVNTATLESGTTATFTLQIPPNQTSSNGLTLTALDNMVRNDGTNLDLNLSTAVAGHGFAAGDEVARLRVNDNDGLTVEIVDDSGAPLTAIDGAGGAATLRATTNGSPASEAIQVRATLTAGDAGVLNGLSVSQDLEIALNSELPDDIPFTANVPSDNLPDSRARTVEIGLELIGATNLVLTEETLTLILEDRDVQLTPTYSATSLAEGGTATVSVSRPAGSKGIENAVTVTVAATNSGSSGGQVSLSGTTLTIPANQTDSNEVMITAGDDAAASAGGSADITLSTATDFYGFSSTSRAATRTITLTDNDVNYRLELSSGEIYESENTQFTLTAVDHTGAQTTGKGNVTVQLAVTITGGVGLNEVSGPMGNAPQLQIQDGNPADTQQLNATADTSDAAGGTATITATISEGSQFATGETERTFTLDLRNDDILSLTATNPTSEVGDGSITIASNATRSGATTLTGTVSSPRITSRPLTITALPDGSAASATTTVSFANDGDSLPAGTDAVEVTVTSGNSRVKFTDGQTSNSVTITRPDDDVLLTASLDESSIDEGEAATLTVTRPTATSSAVSVGISAAGADAGGLDNPPTTLQIAAGQTSGSVTLRQRNDDAEGADTSATLTLTAPTGFGFSSTSTTTDLVLTLTDDDATLTAAFDKTSIDEGETATLTISATRGGSALNVDRDVTVQVAVPAGVNGPSSITIPSGESSFTGAYLQPNDDAPSGTDIATFTLTENLDGYALDATATISTFLSDSDIGLELAFTNNNLEEGESTTLVVTAVDHNGDATNATDDVTVSIALTDSGGGFNNLSAPTERNFDLTIAANSQSAEIRFVHIDDRVVGPQSSVTATASLSRAGYSFASGDEVDTLTLTDSDAQLNVALAATLAEGGSTNLVISTADGENAAAEVTLTLTELSFTASNNAETIALSEFIGADALTVTLPSGQSSVTQTLTALNDHTGTEFEGDNTELVLRLTVTSPDTFAFADGDDADSDGDLFRDLALTLLDNDSLNASFSNTPLDEGEQTTLTVTTGGAPAPAGGIEVLVSFAVIAGVLFDAANFNNFDADESPTQTITIAEGGTEGTAVFNFRDNRLPNAPASIGVTLQSQTGGIDFATDDDILRLNLPLVDNDAALTATLSEASIDEGEATTLTVTRPASETRDEVTIAISATGADAGDLSYDPGQTLRIAAGDASGSVTITQANDHQVGADGAVELTLTVNNLAGLSTGYSFLEEIETGVTDVTAAATTDLTLDLTDDDVFLQANINGLTGNSLDEGADAMVRLIASDGPTLANVVFLTEDVTVDLTFTGDTGRLTTIPATVTIPSGSAQGDATFTLGDDGLALGDGEIRVTLSEDLDGYTLDNSAAAARASSAAPTTPVITLLDEEVAIEIDAAFDAVISEGQSTTLRLTRSLTNLGGETLAVVAAFGSLQSAPGATAGTTITLTPTPAVAGGSHTFNFAANAATSDALTLLANDNNVVGDNTILTITLTADARTTQTGFAFDTGPTKAVTLNLRDNDGLRAGFGAAQAEDIEIDDENGQTTVQIRTDNAASGDVDVKILFPADARDYLSVSTNYDAPDTTAITLTIPDGGTAPTSDLTISARKAVDDLPGSDRTVTLALSTTHATLTLSTDELQLTLADNDVRLTATPGFFTLNERQGTTSTTLTLTRSASTTEAIEVTVGGGDGRVEFTNNGVLRIAAGQTSSAGAGGQSVTITTIDNDIVDASDVAALTLSVAAGASHGFSESSRNGALSLTIRDEDVTLTAAFSTLTIDEGDAVELEVRRRFGDVSSASSFGTAVAVAVDAPDGFVGPGTITIPANSLTASETYRAFDDRVVGGAGDRAADDRSFEFGLSVAQAGFAIARSPADFRTRAVTVRDDALLRLVSPASVTAGEAITLTIERPTTAGDAAIEIEIGGNGAAFVNLEPGETGVVILDGQTSGSVELSALEDIGDNADTIELTLTSQTGDFAFESDPLKVELGLRPASTPQDEVSVRIAAGSLRIDQPGGSFTAGSQTEFVADYDPVQVTGELIRYGTNWQVVSGGRFLNIPDSGGAVEIVRDLERGFEIPQYTVNALPRAAGTAQLQLTITELDANERPIPGTEILSNVIVVTVVAPRVVTPPAPPPPPVNPPDVTPPTVIGGNEVADTASGGDFDGPANSGVVLPPGAVPSAIGFVGVALVELDAPPAPEDLPPELGEFIEGALILDVTFQTQRGVTVSILENAATVCLPVNQFILAAVGGAVERLQIVRYHNGSWGGLVSEYRADEGVICAESQVFSEFALTALPTAQVELPGGDAGVGLTGALPQTGAGVGLTLPLWLVLTLALAGAASLTLGGLVVIRRRNSAG